MAASGGRAVSAPHRWLGTRADVTVTDVTGWPVYDIGPRGGSPSRRVLYLHGGAYVAEVGAAPLVVRRVPVRGPHDDARGRTARSSPTTSSATPSEVVTFMPTTKARMVIWWR